MISFVLPSTFIFLANPKSVFDMKVFLKSIEFTKLFFSSFIYGLSAFAFFGALQKASSSAVVISLSQIQVILTILLSAVFLNDRKNLPQKFFASFLSIIGVLFLQRIINF
ncbi:MAG: hypothetical protein Fur0024_1870 [Patescibacteria group bacterium]